MSVVYVLRLKDDKYYVGITQNMENRYDQHKRGKGPEWTKLYPPIEIVEQRYNASGLDEEVVTKEYMMKYGIDNVRGAQYSQVNLNMQTYIELEKSIWSAMGACLRCGRMSHYVDKCYAKSTVDGRLLRVDEDKTQPSKKIVDKEKEACTRCGRTSHRAEKCYAKTTIDGTPLIKSEEVVDRTITRNNPLATLEDIETVQEDTKEMKGPNYACLRCGRMGHWASACNADTHMNGERLRARQRHNPPASIEQCCTIL